MAMTALQNRPASICTPMADLRLESRRFLSFLMVGTIGFGVDLGVFHLAEALLHSTALAKALSWGVAVTTNFSINSLLTFRTPARGSNPGPAWRQGLDWRRFPGYTATQALGGVVNIGLFLLLHPHMGSFPSLALATAAAAGCNYLGARAVLGGHSGHHRP
jgi:putative flippase GtrA